jgi:hypothetical protein
MRKSFNSEATAAAIEALVENLTYANSSNTPLAKRVLVVNITDAAGLPLTGDPQFTHQLAAENPFNRINVGSASAPSFADLDGHGDLDAVVRTGNGWLNYYENTGTAIVPTFAQRTGALNPVDGIEIGCWSNPSFADLDGDGDLDLLIGRLLGDLIYFENTGTDSALAFDRRSGSANPFDGVDLGNLAAPSLADLDGDGDLDMLLGTGSGRLSYFENTPFRGKAFTVLVTPQPVAVTGTEAGDDLSGTVLDELISGLGGDDRLWAAGLTPSTAVQAGILPITACLAPG